MNLSTQIHTDIKQLPNVTSPVYFSKEYLASQKHSTIIAYETAALYLPIVLEQHLAISMPKSPFGSFLILDPALPQQQLRENLEAIQRDLKSRGVTELVINHPSPIYPNFDDSWLKEVGFEVQYHEINQHIELQHYSKSNIHTMQQRKLKSLAKERFEFRPIPIEEVATVHQFIRACRQSQGLEINIPLETLEEQVRETRAYDFFGVYRDSKISAACITVRVSEKVAYYYLPATSPMFRSQSPMVLLIQGMVEHYHQKGFQYFDLGISSIKGKPQETLRLFKNRMGASETFKTTWKLQV